ncbi:hypothetical protein B6D29_01360 [Microgenomates bacterium UTCPR1]|nr:MAG: hypothetical protein B6D29_01360 [Microgenomates bacterium UTCPR1]
MDSYSLLIDEKKKIILEKELTNYLFEAVRKSQIVLTDIRPIAQEILVDFERIKNNGDLINFLEKINKKWPFFSFLLTKYKGESTKLEEKQVIDKLSSFIKNSN